MRRPPSQDILSALSTEAAGFLAVLLVFVVALGVWRLSAHAPNAPREFPDASVMTSSTELAAGGGAVEPPTSPPPVPREAQGKGSGKRAFNVILITVDTLRWDLGYTGYPRPISPNMDALASRSVVYEHAYATASYTMKCLGPLLIGRYASETARDYQHYTTFYPSNTFLAERVQAAGGRTVAGTTHHYFRSGKRGFEQGFDVWDTSAIPTTTSDNETAVTSHHLSDAAIALLNSPRANEIPVRRGGGGAKTPTGPAAGRFFAWFHYLDPHTPYVPHEGAPNFGSIQGQQGGGAPIPRERAAYDGEVWFTDKHIGRLLNHINAQPWAAETAIILTADHGEAFGERGYWKHGKELWEPLVHVPFIVYVPGAVPKRINVKRSHIDIVPTILELMGIPIAATNTTGTNALRGKSLVGDVNAAPNATLEERDVYMDMPEGQFNEMRRAILTGPSPGLKLIDMGSGIGSGRYELFDLKNDPGETKNLSGDPARLKEATDALQRLRAGLQEVPSAH